MPGPPFEIVVKKSMQEELAKLLMPDLRFQDGDVPARAREHLELGELPGFLIFGGAADEVRELTEGLVRETGRPLLFAADLERGAGQQFSGLSWLPTNMALAATGRTELAYQCGLWTAREAASVGVRLIFSPVVDVHTHAENPIIGSRSFGSDPALVGRMSVALCRGILEGGGLPCGKHFPGHGSTAIDSHVGMAQAAEQQRADYDRHLSPFEQLIAAKVMPTLMSAHVAVAPLDPSGLPATWSREILVALLRETMGYDGLVLSDALLMGAMDQVGPGEAAWNSLLGGVDLLLAPRDPAETLRLMADRPEAAGFVREAGERVAALQASAQTGPGRVDLAATASLAEEVCRESITLLDPTGRFRPFSSGGQLLLTGQRPDRARIEPLREQLGATVVCCPLAELNDAMEIPALVVFDSSIGAWQPSPFEPTDYPERLAPFQRGGATLLMLDHPGPARALAERGPVLLSYGGAPEQQRAAAAVLLGQSTARGVFPGTGC